MNEDSLLIENNYTLQIERGGGVSHDFRDAILGRGRKKFETTAEIYMRNTCGNLLNVLKTLLWLHGAIYHKLSN